MKSTEKRGLAATLAVTLLIAAGCGGGSSAVTAANTPKQLAADKTTAKQALLTAKDLPGYKSTPHNRSTSNDPPPAVVKKFVSCSGLPERFINSSKNDQPNADSPDFSKGRIGRVPTVTFESSVELDRSSKDISDPLSHLKNAAKCFEPVFKAIFAQSSTGGAHFGNVSVDALDVGSIGDQSAAFQGSVTVSGNGRSIDVAFDLYFVRRGRAAVEMTTGIRQASRPALGKSLLNKIVDRLKGAR